MRTPKCRVMPGIPSGTQRDQRRAGDDAVGDASQALDLVDDLVADRQPRKGRGVARPELGQTAVAAGAGTQHVTRAHLRAARGVRDDLADGPVGVRPLVAAVFAAVDRDDHLEVVAVLAPPRLDLVLRDEPRPESRRRVLALGRAQAHLHLIALHVARAPVVEQAEAHDVIGGVLGIEVLSVAPDDDTDLALEIEILAARRHPDGIVGAHERTRVREVEHRNLDELLWQLAPLSLADHLDVLADLLDAAHRRRAGAGRQEPLAIDAHDLGRRRQRPCAGGGQPLAVGAEQVDQPRPRRHRVDLVASHHADPLGRRGRNLKRRPTHEVSPYFPPRAASRIFVRYVSLPCWSRRPTLLWKYWTPSPRNFGTRLSGQLQPAIRPAPVMILTPRSIIACTSGCACWPV